MNKTNHSAFKNKNFKHKIVFDGKVMGFIELIVCLINFRSM
jgi:hypothetical protein